jgi:hypothetical protein
MPDTPAPTGPARLNIGGSGLGRTLSDGSQLKMRKATSADGRQFWVIDASRHGPSAPFLMTDEGVKAVSDLWRKRSALPDVPAPEQ